MVSGITVALEIACRQRGDVRLLIEHEIPLPTATPGSDAGVVGLVYAENTMSPVSPD